LFFRLGGREARVIEAREEEDNTLENLGIEACRGGEKIPLQEEEGGENNRELIQETFG